LLQTLLFEIAPTDPVTFIGVATLLSIVTVAACVIPARRAALIDRVWASDATYTDPTVHTRGGEELLAHIARVHARRPGSKVERTSHVDLHHGVARFGWHAVDQAGAQLVHGIDVVSLTEDGA
jgi:hypothetical protein